MYNISKPSEPDFPAAAASIMLNSVETLLSKCTEKWDPQLMIHFSTALSWIHWAQRPAGFQISPCITHVNPDKQLARQLDAKLHQIVFFWYCLHPACWVKSNHITPQMRTWSIIVLIQTEKGIWWRSPLRYKQVYFPSVLFICEDSYCVMYHLSNNPALGLLMFSSFQRKMDLKKAASAEVVQHWWLLQLYIVHMFM